jgi:hypothetical protein
MQKLVPIFLKIIGLALLLIGLVAAYYGPLEIYVFYLFSEGGRFHYEGFGVGSLWFAYLVVQNIGYYIIAALCIPVGIGHLNLRRWALTLTRLYCWFWLGTGILLAGNLLLLLPAALNLDLGREVLLLRLLVVGFSALITLITLPILALWFYRSAAVRSAFEAHDPNTYWTESYPLPLLALLLLFAIMILVLHVAYFFQGAFPLFGQIMLGRPSASVLSLCILILGVLMVGIARLRAWAWWGSLVTISLLLVSSAMSFYQHGFYDLIQMMNLPGYEMELLDGLVLLHDYNLVGLVVPPLLIALGLLVYSRTYFN